MGPEHDGAVNKGGDGQVLLQGGREPLGEVRPLERYVIDDEPVKTVKKGRKNSHGHGHGGIRRICGQNMR